MAKIVYKFNELLNLRHFEIIDLSEKMTKLLLETSDYKMSYGKDHQYIHKHFNKIPKNFGICACSKELSPYLMKENKYPEEYSCNRQIPITKVSPHILQSTLFMSKVNRNKNYYGSHIQYPFFNVQLFPPGSRIIKIEPGFPLPKGAVPVPFRFEDESTFTSSHVRTIPRSRPIFSQNHSQNNAADKSKTKRYRHLQMSSKKPNISTSNKSKYYPLLNTSNSKPNSNPYSVTGFFPENKMANDISIPDTDTDKVNNNDSFCPNLPNTSQTSINDTDGSTTIGSSCDSYNIQIQISATH